MDDAEKKFKQMQEALLIQRDFLTMALQMISDLVMADGRPCDDGGPGHPLTINADCPGCRARSFLDQLIATGLIGVTPEPGDTRAPPAVKVALTTPEQAP
jgi:hypothetical protein